VIKMFICDICGKEFKGKGNHWLTHTLEGFIPWNKGGGNYRPESLIKMSISQKSRFKRMPTPFKGRHHTEESNEKNRQAHLGSKIHMSEETNNGRKKKLSKARRGVARPAYIGQITAERNRQVFNDPIRKENQLRKMNEGMLNRPTSLEKHFIALCQKYNLPFRYVGNGEIWISKMNPDFININGKKQVLEVLGNYWHTKEETQKRIKNYAQYGFECITIWEDELKDENLILARLGVQCRQR